MAKELTKIQKLYLNSKIQDTRDIEKIEIEYEYMHRSRMGSNSNLDMIVEIEEVI